IIKDFPGNYSDYRYWKTEHDKQIAAQERENNKHNEPVQQRQPNRNSNRMTFKERREFEGITAELDELNKEKASLEELFNSGAVIDDMAEKAKRYNELKGIIDEKEFRWLELSEKDA
ncbi:MAG: ABC transporter C-terminal domain-containing protein, partial [Muribaculaceae bacterium]